MVVHVRLFAILRERAGRDRVELELAPQATVADALRALAEVEPLGELLERLPVRLAVNRDYGSPETVLEPGDELALIPPVSGGAQPAGVEDGQARPHVRVSQERLSLEAVARAVGDPGAGAIVIFEGVTREVDRLDYEAYAEMAETKMREIAEEIRQRWGIQHVAMTHRTGRLGIGEASVVIAVGTPHRKQAFEACEYAIDRLKVEVPVWKKEIGPDGEEWVE